MRETKLLERRASKKAETIVTLAPLAAIDVGSNTIHLTVARPTPDGADLEYVADELELVRLGADLSQTGAIGAERMAHAIEVVRHQSEVARAGGAELLLGIATEGVRAASNGLEFLERVRAETGVTLELISGDQEAALTYWGATSGLEDRSARRAVLDLGGGSIEIVLGVGSLVQWRTSLPLGSGAMHDRFAPADPATAEQLAAVRAHVERALASLDLPLPVDEALAAGGTATTLAALAARALTRDGKLAASKNGREPHIRRLNTLTDDMLHALLGLLQARSAAEIATRYEIEEGRARLLGAGTAVLLATMQRLGVGALRVRKRGIREGAMLAYLHFGAGWLRAASEGAGW